MILNPLGEDFVASAVLNTRYNACGIFVNTAMGEGCGIIAFKYAVTGATQIIPKHTGR